MVDSDAELPQKKSAAGDDDETNDRIVKIWSKVVDTQMHFNEMSVKSRQLGLTFVAAALGLALFFLMRPSTDTQYSFMKMVYGKNLKFHVAQFILLAAALATYAVQRLDLGVYHQMLRGAVAFGEDLEENHLRKILNLNKGMTQAISHFSRNSDAAVTKGSDHRYAYCGSNHKNAGDKIKLFYQLVIWSLVVTAGLLFAVENNLI